MKADGIYSALSLSFLLHVMVATLSFFAAREFYTNHHIINPYIVSLVNTDETAGPEGGGPPAAAPEAPVQEKEQIAKPVQKPAVNPSMTIPENKKKKEAEDKRIKESLEVLRAEKKIEKMAALRKIIDVGTRSGSSSGALPGNNKPGSGGSMGGGADYYSLIQTKIRQQWIYPDTLDKDLETIVSIRIANDGTVTIEKVEKRSGSALFDRSVLRAITAASPLPRPLHEEEIGLRFSP